MKTYAETMANSFRDELKKIAQVKKQSGIPASAVALPVAGALGWEYLRRANQDRKMGQSMRMQQTNQIF